MGYTSLKAASFAAASSASPVYSSDGGINSNSVMSTRKRLSSVDMDGRELRSSGPHEGGRRSSRMGAEPCNCEIRQLGLKKKTIPHS